MDAVADVFELSRFVDAQADTYETALAEIRAGYKVSHWMWFIFPQLAGLGHSSLARRYAIKSPEEARAFLVHPVLGPRLVACAEAALRVEGKTAYDIFDTPDDLKLRSCATLFALVSPSGSVFAQLLDKYYDGEPDARTIQLFHKTEPA